MQLILFHRRLFRLSFHRAPLQNGKLFHDTLTPEDVPATPQASYIIDNKVTGEFRFRFHRGAVELARVNARHG
jgi:hypothetical protein